MASKQTRLHLNPSRLKRLCESQKVSYPTYDAALDAAEHMMGKGLVDPGCHIMPYQCDRCDEWHVANRIILPDGRRRR